MPDRLTDERYSRQILFQGIGQKGQAKLSAARVVVVGCGALGTVISEQLVRAGIGFVRIVDRDFVELSNLQRQSLYTEKDADDGIPKAVAAARVLRTFNSGVEITSEVTDLTFQNIESLCGDADLIFDGTDNFETRYLLNDFSVKNGTPWFYGAAVGSYGLSFAVLPVRSGCLRCLFPELPSTGGGETCETAGIISPVTQIVASFEVAQGLRYLVEGECSDRILQIDVWKDEWRSISGLNADPGCWCCGKREFPFLNGVEQASLTRLCGRNAVQISPQGINRIDLKKLAGQLERIAVVSQNEYLLRLKVDRFDVVLFSDGRAVVKGTDDPSVARSVYAKYIGN